MKATWSPGWRFSGLVLLLGLVTPGAMATSALAAGQTAPQGQITFTKHIAPILQRSCQNCHRPSGVAPMSLVTYADVRPWARAIRQQTSLREMPPWFIEKDIGVQKFKDDISLSDEEIVAIAKWANSGAPRGNPVDMPPPRTFAEGNKWTIGKPDLIVSSSVHTVEALATDYYGTLATTPTGLTEDRYIKAVEIKEVKLKELAGPRTVGDLNLFVVHHAVIASRTRSLDGDDGPQLHERSSGTFSMLYNLGQNATIYPDALGVLLAAGSVINWDVHLHSVGAEMPFRIDVAFKFHPTGYKPKYVDTRGLVMYQLYDLDIPAGARDVLVEGTYPVSEWGILMTFEPHMHSSGTRMCVEAIYPNGIREMLNCARYNHNWVKAYVYEDDVAPLLPKGTILRIIGWYDNSAGNPRVADARNWKGWGERSSDDMFGFLPRFIPLTEEQFQEEVARRQGS